MGRARLVLAVAFLSLVATGCGGESATPSAEVDAQGAQVFADAGCGGCHTLAAAGSNGSAGPNLDALAAQRRPGRAPGSCGWRRHALVRVQARAGRDRGGFGLRRVVGAQDHFDAQQRVQARPRHRVRLRETARFVLLRAGVRQPRVRARPGRRTTGFPAGDRREPGRRVPLPSDRAQDRRRRAAAVPRRRGPCVRRRQRRVRVRLLPRAPAVEARRCGSRRGRRSGARRVRRRAHRCGAVHALPVRPRPRPRPDALREVRPPTGTRSVPRAAGRFRPGLVHRRRLHGEPADVVRR